MDQGLAIELSQRALYLVLLIILPPLGAGLITGLLVAIMQATTQIQEQTLAFVPKIFAVLIAIGIFGTWMMTTLTDFVLEIYRNIPNIIGMI